MYSLGIFASATRVQVNNRRKPKPRERVLMNRKTLTQTFEDCKAARRPAFITYTCCGYKSKAETVEILLALERGGANIIELGVPSSDPHADGPTIQKAHRIGISQGISLRDVLSTVWEARKKGLSVPVVLMGYSSVLKIGSDKLCVEAKKAGVDGFIIVGVSSEDAKTLSNASKKHDLAFIPLIFPTTPEGQMREIGALAHGFVYCVSHNGVTGIRPELPSNLSSFMAKVRRHISLPLALGFGMATRRHFLQAGVVADGVVMGSKIIKIIDESPNDTASRVANVEKFCQSVVYGK